MYAFFKSLENSGYVIPTYIPSIEAKKKTNILKVIKCQNASYVRISEKLIIEKYKHKNRRKYFWSWASLDFSIDTISLNDVHQTITMVPKKTKTKPRLANEVINSAKDTKDDLRIKSIFNTSL